MIELRPYQKNIVSKGVEILRKKGIVYLAMEVRTGKTLTSLAIARESDASNLLFVTKKKAIKSIQDDYKALNPDYDITVTNFESVHKVDAKSFDMVVVDEAHSLGAFPKRSKRTSSIREIVKNKPLILLSGTPTPESYSQVYHQFWISQRTPFQEGNFYKWASIYVDIKKKYVAHGNEVNDYSNAHERLIRQVINPYMITLTQQEAGFTTKVEEEVLEVEMLPSTYKLISKIKKDKVFTGKNGGVILADTKVKELQKVHQLSSGTVKLEDGTAAIIDKSKAEFIKEYFKGKKLAIFYKFKEEMTMLNRVFGLDVTESLQMFNMTDKHIALQIIAGREGISLKAADCLVFLNIDFSATSYFQARDRLATKHRTHNKIYWIFSKGGIEHDIYKVVQDKKNFTLKYYDREHRQQKIIND